ncbi:transposase [Devosia ginsengisoli]|uniref:Transposase n=1 Tax=Devosia ginsengisoli TaxID=400770 RepID=A0A5B8LUY3_9HYPH|nr:transposase [Devosia ginsengisoli]
MSRSSTTEPAATPISAASVPRRSKPPRREAGNCLPNRGQSTFEHRRQLVSTQRFTAEFKEEAVRQVVERGYRVPDVAARLGVSAHSLYKWVKAVSPDRSEQQSQELLEAKSEVLRLRSQLRRTEEERDLLKKAARYFAREPE